MLISAKLEPVVDYCRSSSSICALDLLLSEVDCITVVVVVIFCMYIVSRLMFTRLIYSLYSQLVAKYSAFERMHVVAIHEVDGVVAFKSDYCLCTLLHFLYTLFDINCVCVFVIVCCKRTLVQLMVGFCLYLCCLGQV